VSLGDLLRAFEAADLAEWQGLSPALSLGDVAAALLLETEARVPGHLGEERRPAERIAARSSTYAGGLFVWHDGGHVLMLEGRDPFDGGGDPLVAPELGEPDEVLDSVLGRLSLPGGERVYAGRGLAVRVNPENGVLLGVLGFAPTDARTYRARLRPELLPRRLLPTAVVLRSAS
jgi:hypothetical protein